MRRTIVLLLVLALAGCSPAGPTATSVSTATTALAPSTTLPSSSPSTSPPTTPAPQVTTAPATTTTLAPAVEVVLEGGAVLSELRQAVTLGDEVTIRATSDAPGELHLHGYDLFLELDPAGSVELTFVADIPGIFEMELEATHDLVLELTVSQ